ncbi:MAG: glycosyltransferase [Lachnospiraceae bacterium]|nr:glycosyltransferase [Lachnospiraceae bacterium]
MDNKKITIVIAIYNIEKKLDTCIKSIVTQSYRNLEIILIDDGSTDKCSDICEKWRGRDNRVKVVHKQNAGLGNARNTGIENATGEYIWFVDGDDYIEANAVERLYASLEKEKPDIVIFGFKTIDQNGKVISEIIPNTGRMSYEGEAVQRELLPDLISPNLDTGYATDLHMSAWASVYSTKLIRETSWKFVSEREFIAEDVYSLLELYQYVNKVVILKEGLYCYCFNENSITHTFRPDRYNKILQFYQACLRLWKKNNYIVKVKDNLSYPYMSFTIAAMEQIVASEMSLFGRYKEIKEIILEPTLQETAKTLKDSKVSIQWRVLCRLIVKKRILLCFALLRYKSRLKK